MAVFQATTWQVMPGRGPEVLDAFGQGKRIHERLGAKVFAAQPIAAGPTGPQLVYVMAFDNYASWARTLDALPADQEWLQLTAKYLNVPNPGATFVGTTVAEEIAGFESSAPLPAAGSVLQRTSWMVNPGRVAESIANVADVRAILQRHGGTAFRFTQTFEGGSLMGTLTVSVGAASLQDYARILGAVRADPEYQALSARIQSSGAGHSMSRAIARVLPI